MDPEATWLYGHTQRITFGTLFRFGTELRARVRIEVPCRYAKIDDGQVRCGAHRYRAALPKARRRRQTRQLGNDRFVVVQNGQPVPLTLKGPPQPRRQLSVLSVPKTPCVTARCQTSDHTVGAACCRDLQVEILCTKRNRHLEDLVRTRKSPYLCKVSREAPDSLGAEMISACGYLEDGGVLCTLHGRSRPDGRPAKPGLCSKWPKGQDARHPGCAF
ncbi:MAG: hypothetical protein KF785_10840 [Gemmatimonadales bacterium]|nr:hypothetical protein [Gemmatimonadales bacterium]